MSRKNKYTVSGTIGPWSDAPQSIKDSVEVLAKDVEQAVEHAGSILADIHNWPSYHWKAYVVLLHQEPVVVSSYGEEDWPKRPYLVTGRASETDDIGANAVNVYMSVDAKRPDTALAEAGEAVKRENQWESIHWWCYGIYPIPKWR